MSAHARLSPSSAHKWLACPGSLVLEDGMPDNDNAFSQEGTAAHFLQATVLRNPDMTAHMYVGETIVLWSHPESDSHGEEFASVLNGADGAETLIRLAEIKVTEDMADFISGSVHRVHDRIARHKLNGAVEVQMFVEVRVDHGTAIGVPGQFGTADVVLLVTWADGTMWAEVIDLKYGRGVEVSAEENEQLMLYALGVYTAYELVGDITAFTMVIDQPRVSQTPSEWECSKDHLFQFAEKASRGARMIAAAGHCAAGALGTADPAFAATYLNPGESQCRFCKAKATCPALAEMVQNTIDADFEDITAEVNPILPASPKPLNAVDLSTAMKAADLIEQWCKAVRAEVERRLLAGDPVEGYKLVEGRQGARAWSDAEEVEKTLKAMRLKDSEMYDWSLISPTTAEKLAKAKTIGPKQWPKLQSFITRSSPRPSVAPVSDKRPALVVTPVADDFADVSGVKVPETAEDLV